MKTIRIDTEVADTLARIRGELGHGATWSDAILATIPEPQRWYSFTDAAQVAPDTLHSAEVLSSRYLDHTGERISVPRVRALMRAAG